MIFHFNIPLSPCYITLKKLHQLFSGRSLRTVAPACHISLSRIALSSSFNFSR